MGFAENYKDLFVEENTYDTVPAPQAPHTAGTRNQAVVLLQPRDMQGAVPVAEAFSAGKTALISLDAVTPEMARRILDFLAGACYVKHAQLKAVTSTLYMALPCNVEFMDDTAPDWREENDLF